MSAPDVERLVEKWRGVSKDCYEEANRLDEEESPRLTACLRGRAETFLEAAEALAALSHRPDSIPPQDDVAGRLAKALEEVLPLTAIGKLSDTYQNALEALAAYRANPSGWIPVGERLPELLLRMKAICQQWRTFDNDQFAIMASDINEMLAKLPPPPQDEHSGRIYTDPEEIDAAQRREGKA